MNNLVLAASRVSSKKERSIKQTEMCITGTTEDPKIFYQTPCRMEFLKK